MNFSELIKESGLSDSELAEQTGVTRQAIWKIRNRQIKQVSFELGTKLLNIYNDLQTTKKAS